MIFKQAKIFFALYSVGAYGCCFNELFYPIGLFLGCAKPLAPKDPLSGIQDQYVSRQGSDHLVYYPPGLAGIIQNPDPYEQQRSLESYLQNIIRRTFLSGGTHFNPYSNEYFCAATTRGVQVGKKGELIRTLQNVFPQIDMKYAAGEIYTQTTPLLNCQIIGDMITQWIEDRAIRSLDKQEALIYDVSEFCDAPLPILAKIMFNSDPSNIDNIKALLLVIRLSSITGFGIEYFADLFLVDMHDINALLSSIKENLKSANQARSAQIDSAFNELSPSTLTVDEFKALIADLKANSAQYNTRAFSDRINIKPTKLDFSYDFITQDPTARRYRKFAFFTKNRTKGGVTFLRVDLDSSSYNGNEFFSVLDPQTCEFKGLPRDDILPLETLKLSFNNDDEQAKLAQYIGTATTSGA